MGFWRGGDGVVFKFAGRDVSIARGVFSVKRAGGGAGDGGKEGSFRFFDGGKGRFISFSDWAERFSLPGRTPILENIYDVIATEFSKIELVLSKEAYPEKRDAGEGGVGGDDLDGPVVGDGGGVGSDAAVVGDGKVYTKLSGHPNYRVLALRPNAFQTKSDLLYTVAYQLHMYRNALVRIVRDEAADRNVVLALEPIDCGGYLFGQGYDVRGAGGGRTVVLKLKDKATGNIVLYDYEDILHLRLNPNDIFYGDKSDGCDLNRFVTIFDENLSALLTELKEAGSLRGIVEVGASAGVGSFNGAFLGNDDKVDKANEIVGRIKKSDGGIIVLDSGEKWVSLTRSFKTMSTDEVNNFMRYLFNFKGINQAVIDGTASEAAMGVFFNKTIAPIIMRFIEELNYKFLTQTARTQGQKIEYFKNPFEYTSVTDLLKNLYLGAMFFTQNEVRRTAFKMPPLPGGDELLSNKNFDKGARPNAAGGGVSEDESR